MVQGRALGFGCALAALCDITLASDAATFQVPEMAHNILPTMVMSSLIDRVPPKALTYLVYSTAVIGAMRALSVGLVSEIVPAADLEAQVQTLGAALLKAPPPAVRGPRNTRDRPSRWTSTGRLTSPAICTRPSIRRRKCARPGDPGLRRPPARRALSRTAPRARASRSGTAAGLVLAQWASSTRVSLICLPQGATSMPPAIAIPGRPAPPRA